MGVADVLGLIAITAMLIMGWINVRRGHTEQGLQQIIMGVFGSCLMAWFLLF